MYGDSREDYGMLCEWQTGVEEQEQEDHYEQAWKMLDVLEQMVTSFDGGCVPTDIFFFLSFSFCLFS